MFSTIRTVAILASLSSTMAAPQFRGGVGGRLLSDLGFGRVGNTFTESATPTPPTSTSTPVIPTSSVLNLAPSRTLTAASSSSSSAQPSSSTSTRTAAGLPSGTSSGSAGALPSSTASVTAILTNNCPYNVYAWSDADASACASGACDSPLVTVPANGGTYTGVYTPLDITKGGSGGATIKIQKDAGTKNAGTLSGGKPIYQVEYSLASNVLWYNFSPVDGSPFDGEHRSLQPGSSCPKLECQVGDPETVCDWYRTASGLELNVDACSGTPQTLHAVLC